ncbi:hypothetical protein GLYMA_05G128400v4 [Glycine max]|uniref:Uncharacterized protein n=1 Tax=Glycine max TaxID=3847 RepID=K7KPW8_SOYBN|nr:hypothetical protein JHK85_013162 [Glycine max]KAH1134090.1 hypothetical protein GYH30_012487 [Glycine max]KRH58445.1 hypothetical protein GLYMA_05G128400v4 [Glycine max]
MALRMPLKTQEEEDKTSRTRSSTLVCKLPRGDTLLAVVTVGLKVLLTTLVRENRISEMLCLTLVLGTTNLYKTFLLEGLGFQNIHINHRYGE